MNPNLTHSAVFILSGGKGSRLGTICERCPKPLIIVAGRPFIEHVVRYWFQKGVRSFVFLTGYLGEQFKSHFVGIDLKGAGLHFIQEDTPLGTGGAIVFALQNISANPDTLFVINADSFVPITSNFLLRSLNGYAGAIVGVRMTDGSRYGTLQVNEDSELVGFQEKREGAKDVLVNAGIYWFNPLIFRDFQAGQPYSLERDLFPFWLKRGLKFKVIPVEGPFLDIGTPETLKEADAFVASVLMTASPSEADNTAKG